MPVNIMASTKTAATISLDVEFHGVLQTSTRAKLVTELIKFLLYQRQQISLPFEQISQDVAQEEQAGTGVENTAWHRGSPRKLNVRKRTQLVHSVMEMTTILDQLFASGGPIKRVLIAFGATVVNPKEVYVLHFPTGFYDGKILSQKHCTSMLFRQLMAHDLLGGAKSLPRGTKMSVLVEAPRTCDYSTQRLTPKPTFRISPKGQHFLLSFVCRGRKSNPELSHIGDAEFNISGIEAMRSPRDSELEMSCNNEGSLSRMSVSDLDLSHTESQMSVTESGNDDSLVECDRRSERMDHNSATHSAFPECDEDYVWFQLPVTATGFEESMKSL